MKLFRQKNKGFTLIELLVVIAIIAILASMLLPALNSAKGKAMNAKALNNLKQLTIAWSLYNSDNDDEVPAAGRMSGVPEWSGGGWLDLPINERAEVDPNWVRTGNDRSIANSPMWSHAGRNPLLFRDPGDKSIGSWPSYQNGGSVPRVRSYSMNNWVGGPTWGGSGSNANTGKPWKVFRKESEMVQPGAAATIVFISERPDSINDGYFVIDMQGFIGSRFRQRIVDYPAGYHGGAGTVGFADAHAEIHKWKDPRTLPRLNAGREIPLNVSSPNNSDVLWMQQRGTR